MVNTSRITVFGANGRVGRLVVEQLLKKGYDVTAFVHSQKLGESSGLTQVQGDIYNRDDITLALKNSQAVISTLSSWGTPKKDILTVGMEHIVPAMQRLGLSRIVTLTGADARDSVDNPPVLNKLSRPFLKLIAPKILEDGENHIRILRNSNLDWTTLRSPIMRSWGPGGYHMDTHVPRPWETVHRDSVAKALIKLIEDNSNSKQSPYIHPNGILRGNKI